MQPRHKYLISFFIFFFSALPRVAFSTEKKFQIIIDPGHGGNDTGALQNKIKESQLVLILAEKIEHLIHQQAPEVSTILTRTQNKYLSLEERIKYDQADLFLSLHANSSISNQVAGMEAYFQPDQKIIATTPLQTIVQDLESMGKTQQSLQFSKILQSQWGISPSVLRRSSFFVVEKTKSAAVLIEIGFLTNPSEAKKLATEDYQNQIAQTIVNAVLSYNTKN